MAKNFSRRQFLGAGAGALALGALGIPALTAAAQAVDFGPSQKVFWVPQATGSWNIPIRVGQRDFSAMVGWEYQHIGNPVYSVENHVEQVRIAMSSGANIIVTELESPGMSPVFEEAMAAGIVMIVIDQGVKEELERLGLGIIGANGFAEGYSNGFQGAKWGQQLTGRTDGYIVFGNGNPGAALIDARQEGSRQGVMDYNTQNGTTFTFEAFPDSSFDADASVSIQKYGAQIDTKGDELVALITGGNVIPIVQALKERDYQPGQIAAGSVDMPPAHVQAMEEGWTFWGTDQQQYLMGLYSMAAAFGVLQGYPYPSTTTGELLILADDLPRIKSQTDIWMQKAQAYGDIE